MHSRLYNLRRASKPAEMGCARKVLWDNAAGSPTPAARGNGASALQTVDGDGTFGLAPV